MKTEFIPFQLILECWIEFTAVRPLHVHTMEGVDNLAIPVEAIRQCLDVFVLANRDSLWHR
jgi:hypothetical protein